MIPCAVLPIHLAWFKGWIDQQKRLRNAKNQPSKLDLDHKKHDDSSPLVPVSASDAKSVVNMKTASIIPNDKNLHLRNHPSVISAH